MGDLVYEWVCFFKGQVYDWGRFRNTGSHTRTKTKITPKLPFPLPSAPPSPLPPPPPPTSTEAGASWDKLSGPRG